MPPLSAGLPLIDNTLFIDNTTLETMTTCPRQYQYYGLVKRESTKERPALKFGDIVHLILEVKYRNLHLPPEQQTKLMVEKAVYLFSIYSPPEDDYRNLNLTVDAIEHYQKLYSFEPFTIATQNGNPLIEIPFAVPITEFEVNANIPIRNPDSTIEVRWVEKIKVVWTGRIDIVYDLNGKLFGMDHKTTSMMGPTFFREFDTSSQFPGYSWAVTAMGIPLSSFIINALGIRKPTKTGKGFEFTRHTINFTPNSLEEWKRDTTFIISDLISMLLRDYFPRHTKWCVGKYGECQYYNVCVLPEEQRSMMLGTGDYKPVVWNPLDERKV
jgi:hypothetical protein